MRALPLLGATHTAEIPFVIGITEKMPPPNGTCTMSEDGTAISQFLKGAWTSMAEQQKPSANASAWPQFTGPKESMGVQIVDTWFPYRIDYTVCEILDEMNAQARAKASNGTADYR